MLIKVNSNFEEITVALSSLAGDHVNRVFSWAINDTAKHVVRKEREEMLKVFEQPIPPFIANSARVFKGAKANDLTSVVNIVDLNSGVKTPPVDTLYAEVHGGQRDQKKFEGILVKLKVMPSGMFAIPTSKAPKDKYGNIKTSLLIEIIKQFREYGKYTPFKPAKNKKYIFFAIQKQRGRMPPGIWYKDNSGNIELWLIFREKAVYKHRLKFFDVAKIEADSQLEIELNRQLEKALKGGGILKYI